MGPTMGFYRPGYGYMSAVAPAAGLAQIMPPLHPPYLPSGGYQLNEPTQQPNTGPYNYNTQNEALVGPNSNNFASWSQQINDGWASPALPSQGQNQAYTSNAQLYNQQQAKYPQLNSYDSYTVSPTLTTQQPAKQTYGPTTNLDPYGTKGGTLKQQQQLLQQQQQYGTTKK